MKSINTIISEIRTNANKQIIDAIWDRVAQINSMLDDAYGSALGGHYGSALNCAAEAVDSYMELVDLYKETTKQPLREHLRDALGSVKWEKFELPTDMMLSVKKASNEAANPDFHAKIACKPYSSFVANNPFEQFGFWCNKITKQFKGDFDVDIPRNKKYNKPTIKLYEKATVYPEGEERIIWQSFDNIDDLEEYLRK